MAKRKLTKRQKQAKKRAAYYRSEYYATRDALEFLQGFTGVKLPSIPNKITKTSLKAIRQLYKETRQKAKPISVGGYVDVTTGEWFEKLPTKKEMVKIIRTEQPYRQSRSEPEQNIQEDLDEQYIDDIKSKIEAISMINEARSAVQTAQPRHEDERHKSERNYNKNVAPKFEEAMNRIFGAIDQAVAALGAVDAAKILAENDFIQRIENLEEKYTYEIIESQGSDGDIVALIEASVNEALSNS